MNILTEYDAADKAYIDRHGQLAFDWGEIACQDNMSNCLRQARELPGPTTLDRLILGIAHGAERITRCELSTTTGLPVIGVEGVGTFELCLDPTGSHLQAKEVLT